MIRSIGSYTSLDEADSTDYSLNRLTPMTTPSRLLISACILAILSGCANVRLSESPPTQEAQAALSLIQDQYSAGEYGAVIRSVATSDDIATAPQSLRIEAYKLQAFSYCVREYPQLCEETFLRILKIDPTFELIPTEAGHPNWASAFTSAQEKIKSQ